MKREVFCRDLGTMDYKECWNLQKRLFGKILDSKKGSAAVRVDSYTGLVDSVVRNDDHRGTGADGERLGELEFENAAVDSQWLLLVEHPAVYTLGKSGHESNMLAGEEFLKSIGASFYHIDRGGDITFHGPGQLVGYPILDLEQIGIGLREYIGSVEQTVIDTVGEYGISAGRVAGAAGVWITEGGVLRKICAIGVKSSRYVTMHGFALNVNTDLSYFDYINPCGFTDRGVTSIAKEVGEIVDMQDVKQRLTARFEKNLDVKIKY